MTTGAQREFCRTPSLFQPPPARVEIHHNEVHVWRALVDDVRHQCKSFVELLSDRERERSKRFFLERLRTRYIVGQGILRRIISRYTGFLPGKIDLSYGSHGKPSLNDALNIDRLSFNMSRSADCALYAFTRGREVGIDVEKIRETREMQRIVSMFFSEAEQTAFASLLPGQKEQGFFHTWTRKEALVKALGGGLSIPFSSFDVSMAPGEPARLLRLNEAIGSAADWTIADVDPLIGFSGSVAFEGDVIPIRCWNWDDEC